MKEKLIKILRWSEKYTRADMVYLASANFWLNAGRFLSIINGIILSVAFAHLLTKEEYGIYVFALAFAGIFSMPPTAALGAGMNKAVANGEDGVIYEGINKVMPWAFGFALLLFFASIYYFIFNNYELGIVFALSAFALPISVHNGGAKSFLVNKGNFDLQTKFGLIRTPIMTAFILLATFLTRSAFVILIVYIIGNLILGYSLYLKAKRFYRFEKTKVTHGKFSNKFAFHMGLISIFNYIAEQIDNFVIWKFLGAAPVAILSYARSPIRELRTLLENQGLLAIPKFARKEFSEVQSGLLLRIKQMYLLVIPIIVIYYFCSPFLFKFLFPQYLNALPLSQLLILSLLSSPRKLMSAAISSHQKVKESYMITLFPNLVKITLTVYFTIAYGIWGTVTAILLSEVIEYLILGLLMHRIKKIECL